MQPRNFDQEKIRTERRVREREAKFKKKMAISGGQVKNLLRIIKQRAAPKPDGKK